MAYNMRIMFFFINLAKILALFLLAGCVSPSYMAQSIGGHLKIVSSSKSVDALIADIKQPEHVRNSLKVAAEIRQFASDYIALPDNLSYRKYSDLKRDYVSWAVFATPEFSFTPIKICVPIYGCVPYKGYFDKQKAERYTKKLKKDGYDVFVTGIPAYSTLGWTPDPLINTMFRYGETYLAGIIFHELAHQVLYVADDARFNEAFAVAIEQTGVRLWLERKYGKQSVKRYIVEQERYADFLSFIADARKDLATLYSTPMDLAQMREKKADRLQQLHTDYKRKRMTVWADFDRFDRWFDKPITNARLMVMGVYNDLVPAFENLFLVCGQSHERFIKAAKALSKLNKSERIAQLMRAKTC